MVNNRKNQSNDKRSSNSNTNAISPYTPYSWGLSHRFDDIFDEFKRSFDQIMTPMMPFFEPFELGRNGNIQSPARAPFIDLIDEGDHYRVNAELPGFTKDNVDVQLTKDGLVLRAEKKSENEEKRENYLRRERGYSVLERSLDFPEEVNAEKIEGTLNNGVLELRVPKLEVKPELKPKRVQLK